MNQPLVKIDRANIRIIIEQSFTGFFLICDRLIDGVWESTTLVFKSRVEAAERALELLSLCVID